MMDTQLKNIMKHTSLITAAAVLSASTYAADVKFSFGAETSHMSLEGTRAIETLTAVEDYDFDESVGNLAPSLNAISASKKMLGLKAGALMKISEKFDVEAGVILNHGKLETRNARSGVFVEGTGAANGAFLYKEDITTRIKPTFGLGIKAMAGFNDKFKAGLEIRSQRFETTHSGAIFTQEVQASDTNGYALDETLYGHDLTVAATTDSITIKENEDATTETSFGVAVSSMLTESVSFNAGYLTSKINPHTITLNGNLNDFNNHMTGGTSGQNTFNLETEKPTIEQYYFDFSINF